MPITLNGSTGLTANDGSVFTNASGNVGIGTGSPTGKLTVSKSNGGSTSGAANAAIFLDQDESTIQGPGTFTNIRMGGNLVLAANGVMSFNTGNVARGGFDASGNFTFDSGYGSAAIAYGCRAWVNFNGEGTVAIRVARNVSSITDNNTGDYTVNFTTAMPDASYCFQGSAEGGASAPDDALNCGAVRNGVSTGSVRVKTVASGSATRDAQGVFVAIFR